MTLKSFSLDNTCILKSLLISAIFVRLFLIHLIDIGKSSLQALSNLDLEFCFSSHLCQLWLIRD